jgi:hypothetical protein
MGMYLVSAGRPACQVTRQLDSADAESGLKVNRTSPQHGSTVKSETVAALVMAGWLLLALSAVATVFLFGVPIGILAVAISVWVGRDWTSRLRTGVTFLLALVAAVPFTALAVTTIVDGRSEFIVLTLAVASLADALAVGCGVLFWRARQGPPSRA